MRGERRLPLGDFLVGPKQSALAADELITAVHVWPPAGRETFMKIGPRNAMVIAVASLALAVDPDARGLPAYVEREFYDYLQCGVLAHGFPPAGL